MQFTARQRVWLLRVVRAEPITLATFYEALQHEAKGVVTQSGEPLRRVDVYLHLALEMGTQNN